MAKAKVLTISGPVNAKHVSGFNVLANTQTSSIDSYFENTNIRPDLFPSHTFVASGKTEVPRRSDTIVNTIRKPSVSLRRSISRLGRRSISHISELHHRSATPPQADMSLARSESTNVRRPLRMQSSMSRLRQRVGLDKDLSRHVPLSKSTASTVEQAPEPIAKDEPVLKTRRSMPRMTSTTFHGSAERSTSAPPHSTHSHKVRREVSMVTRQPSNTSQSSTEYSSSAPSRTLHSQSMHPKASTIIRQSSTDQRHRMSVERKPSPPLPSQAPPPPPSQKPLVRPKRADSGTAIDFHRLPIDERPLGFQEILSITSHADRMTSYQKAREYWAHADHGLSAWTEGAQGPRMLAAMA